MFDGRSAGTSAGGSALPQCAPQPPTPALGTPARPPCPTAPLQDRTAALVGEGRREAAQQQRLQRQQRQGHRLQQPDSAHGRALEEQQRQAKQLQQKQQQQASGKSSS